MADQPLEIIKTDQPFFGNVERRCMRRKNRLSYVEILIMAGILAVVTIRVGPQVTEASTETKISRLVDALETMRANLDVYLAEHGNCFPPTDSFESFEAAMTTKAERSCPYVRKIPANPFNNLNTVRFDDEPAGAGKAGWRLDTETGLFQADNDAEYAAL